MSEDNHWTALILSVIVSDNDLKNLHKQILKDDKSSTIKLWNLHYVIVFATLEYCKLDGTQIHYSHINQLSNHLL